MMILSKRSALFAFILLSMAKVANAEAPAPYPSTQELYENCKSAVTLADKGDMSGFLHSYCAARITGFYEALLMTRPYLTEEKQKEFDQDYCLPERREYQWAKDFVNAVDHFEKYTRGATKEDFLKNPAPHQMAGLLNMAYLCKK